MPHSGWRLRAYLVTRIARLCDVHRDCHTQRACMRSRRALTYDGKGPSWNLVIVASDCCGDVRNHRRNSHSQKRLMSCMETGLSALVSNWPASDREVAARKIFHHSRDCGLEQERPNVYSWTWKIKSELIIYFLRERMWDNFYNLSTAFVRNQIDNNVNELCRSAEKVIKARDVLGKPSTGKILSHWSLADSTSLIDRPLEEAFKSLTHG